ncbi:hypothetical protein CEP54_014707 [Fusarium duplospermum]|uniref:Apple domain-containing protein n=1 Tax=Fusarium duplospermum TaxID=1325734 RepID=A0A428NU95_9HYPO|nr:hypothetical protein CEP54_014707 [Fusarium duplospermum]
MKYQTLVVLFATAASAVSPPVCGERPAACNAMTKQDKNACKKKIAALDLRAEMCLAPAKTVTRTEFVYPTNTVTKTLDPVPITEKATKTITKKGPAITPPTITLTATEHEITHETVTDTTTETDYITESKTETSTQTDTKTETKTESRTETVDFVAPTCAPAAGRRARREEALPTDCSCLLTVTSGRAPDATSTATVTKRTTTVTEYEINSITGTVTRTVTETKFTNSKTVQAPETTVTTTETETQTDHVPTTVHTAVTQTNTETKTETETSTTTSTQTNVATETAPACVNPTAWIQPGSIKIPNSISLKKDTIIKTTETSAKFLTRCCEKCFSDKNCDFFKITTGLFGVVTCDLYTTKTKAGSCTPAQCPLGFPVLTIGAKDNSAYYRGPCFKSSAN